MNDDGRMIGAITYLNDKGYGFIRYGEDSIFFHAKGLVSGDFFELSIGTIVEFNKSKTDRGFRAGRIIVVEDVE